MGTLVPTEAGSHLGLEWAALVRAVVQPILFRHWCPFALSLWHSEVNNCDYYLTLLTRPVFELGS